MKWYHVISLIILIIFIILLIFGFIMHEIIYGRSKVTKKSLNHFMKHTHFGKYQDIIYDGYERLSLIDKIVYYIESYDHLRLKGYLIKHHENNDKVILLMHGYHSSPFFDFSGVFDHYLDMGFDLFLIEQRAHENSKGRYTTFGIKERYDFQKWAWFLDELYNHSATIIATGISMGSSTILMGLNLELPNTLKGVICDCGYTSPLAILQADTKNLYHFPPYVISWFINLANIITTGKSLNSVNTKNTLKDAKIKVLIVHGKNDHTVPVEMAYQHYEALPVNLRTLKIVDDADHGVSYLVSKDECNKLIDDFIHSL